MRTLQLSHIKKAIEIRANPAKATAMSKYLRDQFPFYGLQATAQGEALKEALQNREIPVGREFQALVNDLWNQPHREYHYMATTLMKRRKKSFTFEDLPFLENLIVSKSWWDTVDSIAPHGIAHALLTQPNQIPAQIQVWLDSENIWLQRVTLIWQLLRKAETDTQLLGHAIQSTLPSNEFFIQKAIGWALRQYAKTDPSWVLNYTATHDLPSLAKREALKHFN
ncbi:MAG: DNA alkylation repair protein [Verrucomicrobiota bacterium]